MIDDTSFETDALIKEMIEVKNFFQGIFDKVKTEGLRGIDKFQAANLLLKNHKRRDIIDLVEQCQANLEVISSKIEEQIDRTGSTLQKLEKFWSYTELRLYLTKSGVSTCFVNEKLEEEEKEADTRKEQAFSL